jgi:hypothetical protein
LPCAPRRDAQTAAALARYLDGCRRRSSDRPTRRRFGKDDRFSVTAGMGRSRGKKFLNPRVGSLSRMPHSLRPPCSHHLPTASRSAQARRQFVSCDRSTRRANQKNLSIPSRKNNPLAPSGKSVIYFRASHPLRGAGRDRHERGWDAVDAECARRACRKRTAKSCGPDVAVLASSWREVSRR